MSIDVGFDAFVDLTDKVNAVHHAVTSKPKPIYKTVAGSALLQAATGIVEISERPSAGSIWNILKVVVLGSDGHTALAGVIVDVYASALVDPSTPALENLIVSGGTGNVPSLTFYSKEVEWCQHGQQIWGQIYGATAGQQVVLLARVAEYVQSEVTRMSI